MSAFRPYALTIAGFDPTNGAGFTADLKTFEQNKVYGLALCTGITMQTEDKFFSVEWRKLNSVKAELKILLKKYPVKAMKFGIVPSFKWIRVLSQTAIKIRPKIKIVIDPILRSSSEYDFANKKSKSDLFESLQYATLITPNQPELKILAGKKDKNTFLASITKKTSVLLKGGHLKKDKGTDYLISAKTKIKLTPTLKSIHPKHGSGCVLSAAITAELAKNTALLAACKQGKKYTEKFLASNSTLLGFHAS